MIHQLLQASIIVGVLASGIRLAAPFLFAALGEMYSQRSGVLNLGVEGIMLMGAFTAFYVTLQTGNPWPGLLAALLVGALMGLAMAFISVTMKAEQGISGIGLHLFGWGLSGLLFRQLVGSIQKAPGFGTNRIPLLADIPGLGPILFDQNWLVYLALLLVPVSAVILFRTTLGLKIRAVGENPTAADSLGVSVAGIRYLCVTFGGLMAGLAGAFLTVGQQEAIFVDNISAGRGFIAVALVYFGRWNPWGVLAGCLLFSVVDALQLWIQVLGIQIPYEYAVMAPYVLTIVALAFAVGRAKEPSALARPFERGEA